MPLNSLAGSSSVMAQNFFPLSPLGVEPGRFSVLPFTTVSRLLSDPWEIFFSTRIAARNHHNGMYFLGLVAIYQKPRDQKKYFLKKYATEQPKYALRRHMTDVHRFLPTTGYELRGRLNRLQKFPRLLL